MDQTQMLQKDPSGSSGGGVESSGGGVEGAVGTSLSSFLLIHAPRQPLPVFSNHADTARSSPLDTMSTAGKNSSPSPWRKHTIANFNPQTTRRPLRLEDISHQCYNFTFIGLLATGEPQDPYDPGAIISSTSQHIAVKSGYGCSPFVNKSCGVTILLSRRYFNRKDIKSVVTPPATLLGRALAVTVKNGHAHFLVIMRYFPPRPTRRNNDIYTKTVNALTTFAHKQLKNAPARCTPLLLTDLNDGLGLCQNGRE